MKLLNGVILFIKISVNITPLVFGHIRQGEAEFYKLYAEHTSKYCPVLALLLGELDV